MSVCHLFHRKRLITGAAYTSAAVCLHIADYLKYITHNSTCCRKLTCSTSVEHGISNCITAYKNSIVGIIYRSKRMFCRNQHRAYISLNTVLLTARNAQQFDLAAHLLSITDIFGCDPGNSFYMNIIQSDSGIKSNGSKNRNLSSCIDTFDICRRICLCISKFCRKGKGIRKFHTLLGHLCEDEVCGSVYDSHNFRHMVGLKAVLQRTDDRNSAGNCCLE